MIELTCGEGELKHSSSTLWWKYKLTQGPWKAIWLNVLSNSSFIAFDPGTAFLGIWSQEII